MDSLNWKIEKIKSLDKELKELHPLLEALFRSMPQIQNVIYTQGNRENGADFVLVKSDEILGQDDYVGVIVKSTPIRQTSDDVHRQIKECTLAPRFVEAKKSVFLTEVWVITSKDITRNVQDFLHLEYKSTKIKFIDGAALAGLIDKYFPRYWDFADAKVSKYITDQKNKITSIQNLHRMLPIELGHIAVDQEIQRIPEDSKRKFKFGKSKPTKLWNEIQSKKLIFIEGGMGSGKSTLLLITALKLCEKDTINNFGYVPYYINYRDLLKQYSGATQDFIANVHTSIGDETKKVVIFVDGLDESQQANLDKVTTICEIANRVNEREDTILVIASRVIDEASLSAEISKSFDKYRVCPLTYGMVVNFIQQICDASTVSNKLKDDLQRSPLMRALPRTPLSAILLGKLLKEHINELPSTLPELYSKYIELVLGRWDLDKGSGSEKEYETLQRLISMVATYLLDNDLDSLRMDEIKEMFRKYLADRRTGQALEPMLAMFLNKSELISYSPEENIIKFRHKTFTEFFYAHSLLMEKGKDAPITRPFDQNWYGIEYFYLGLVRDVPERIEKLSAYIPSTPAEKFIKFSQMGMFLMAGYQTPYEKIEHALYQSFKDAAVNYAKVVSKHSDEWFVALPELQVLSLFTYIVRNAYTYDFFRPALINARLDAELDSGLEEKEKVVLIFLIDAVLAGLNDSSAFQSLIDRHETQLDWTIKLGIHHASNDISFINDSTKYIAKKINRAVRDNRGIIPYLRALESTPIKDRRDIETDLRKDK